MDESKSEGKHIIPGAEKLLCVMEILVKGEAGLSQLMQETGTSTTTCYRILQTLVSHGWIYRTPHGKYAVSAGFALLASRYASSSWERFRPVLASLSERTGLTVKLSIREGVEHVMVLRQESPHPFGVSLKAGVRFPVVEGSVGAALLSKATDNEIERIWERCGMLLTPEETLLTFKRRVREVWAHGYCIRNNIGGRGTTAMSVPVLGAEGHVVAALTILGSRKEFADSKSLGTILLDAAENLQSLL